MNAAVIQQREAQPAIVMRADVPLGGIGAALHRILPSVFTYVPTVGGLVAGAPFTRYLGFGEGGTIKIEAGVPTLDALPSCGELESIVLDGGPCVTLLHEGSYDWIPACHQYLDEWFEATGHKPAGFRWEAYLTDPNAEPDTSKWRTLITQALEPQE